MKSLIFVVAVTFSLGALGGGIDALIDEFCEDVARDGKGDPHDCVSTLNRQMERGDKEARKLEKYIKSIRAIDEKADFLRDLKGRLDRG